MNSGKVNRVNIKAETWIEIFSEELKISKKSKTLAKRILEIGGRELLRSGAPSTNAAAVLYLACKKNKENLTVKTIAAVAKKTSGTIGSAIQSISLILEKKGHQL